MYRVGDTVLYGVNGVCYIEEEAQRTFGGVTKDYYVLKPLSAPGSTVYVPKDSEKLLARMRRILSEDEIRTLIRETKGAQLAFTGGDNERKQRYSAALDNADPAVLIGLLKAVLQYQEEQQEKGKKLHLCDERFLASAGRVLYDEFSMVLKIRKEDVLPLILEG